MNQGHISRERPRWRNKNVSDNRPKMNTDTKVKVTTSEWIKVSNIPPMSKLSDVFPSLNQIIEYEMQKGIIDLDALDNTGFDNVTSHALDSVGALNSLYSTKQISDGKRSIPLWTPPSSDSDEGETFPMILEARVHLSYRARPMGWFLRLPNRSVVHAVLNHVRRAENEQWGKWHLPNEAKNLKHQRKKWREGLWKGVWNEYERGVNEENTRVALEDESHDEKELMWGDGLKEEEEEDDNSLVKSPLEEGVEMTESCHAVEQKNDVDAEEKEHGTGAEKQQNEVDADEQKNDIGAEGQQNDIDAEEQQNAVDSEKLDAEKQKKAEKQKDSARDYIEEYSQSHPFPTQLAKPNATHTPLYQLVKSGSTALSIREFAPYPSDNSLSSNNHNDHPPWEQHSFHLSPLLNLSDSVIRVETENLRINEEDIQYFFRGYDLEAIMPESREATSFPSCYSDFPKSIGWNVNMQGNVDFIVKGNADPQRQQSKYPRNRDEKVPIGARRHTFLVRFATSADARMAVRDKKGTTRDGLRLSVTQYPQQW